MKVVQLNEWTLRQFLNPTLNPKIAHWTPIVKNNPKNKSKSNVRIEGNKEKKSCGTIWVDFKTI